MAFLSHKLSFRTYAVKKNFAGCGQARRCYAVMTSRTYDHAINLLNGLQTPYEVLKKRWDAGIKLDGAEGVRQMRSSLVRIGYTQEDLTRLNIVHVAGTKGKGSTCAYVDSILSKYRKSHDHPKVGLFTSPHLIAVRERIRINSAPISADSFAKYFFEVWDKLEANPTESGEVDKPVYFRYLTLLSYHVFIQEKVDVGIYEVGVGGEYDSTNTVDVPAVTGISALGIDHTFTLGDTIEEIAWNKAGIQKSGVPSFTVKQPQGAMQVVKNIAEERSVKGLVVLEQDPRLACVKIKPDAPFQKSNASLAIALTETVLSKINPNFTLSLDSLPAEFIEGLETVVWRGRCEKKLDGDITWYLDGAHTADSMKVATKWFSDESSQQSGKRILIFNQQGHREALELLEGLYNGMKSEAKVDFDHVIFCPTIPSEKTTSKDFVNLSTDAIAVAGLTLQKSFAEKWNELDGARAKVSVLSGVEDAFDYARKLSSEAGEGSEDRQVHTFITGSVHLVGRALGILEDVDAL